MNAVTGAALVEFSLVRTSVLSARFGGATLNGKARFNGATFAGNAEFGEATFTGDARFDEATFTAYAGFYETTFIGAAWFEGAMFTGYAAFYETTFTAYAEFDGSTFAQEPEFRLVRVRHLDDPALHSRRTWPQGWTVEADPNDSTQGTLVWEPTPEAISPASTPE